MDVDNKYGNHQWSVVTNMIYGWKIVSVNVENSEKLMNLFKDRQTKFGLDPLQMVTTDGNGAIKDITRTIDGEYYWDADISNFKSVIVDIHVLSLD